MLSKIFRELCSTTLSVIILGDFNFPDINWETLSGGSQVSNIFCDLVFDNNLTQLIGDPAHVEGNILDVILTSTDELACSVAVNPHNNVLSSDHFIICFQVCLFSSPAPSKNAYWSYDYFKADFIKINQFIIDSCPLHSLSSINIESVWNLICSTINNAISSFVLMFQSHQLSYLVWFNSDLRHQMKCLRT